MACVHGQGRAREGWREAPELWVPGGQEEALVRLRVRQVARWRGEPCCAQDVRGLWRVEAAELWIPGGREEALVWRVRQSRRQSTYPSTYPAGRAHIPPTEHIVAA